MNICSVGQWCGRQRRGKPVSSKKMWGKVTIMAMGGFERALIVFEFGAIYKFDFTTFGEYFEVMHLWLKMAVFHC